MRVILLLFSLILFSSFGVVSAQEMEFYQNEKYDFSFEIPKDWEYQEDVFIDMENTEEVFFFPQEFSMENAGDDKTMMDIATEMMGWQFQFESPLIGVDFRTISTSDVPILTEENILEHFLDKTMDLDPSTEILESYSKTHSYGWEVGIISTINFDFGDGSPMTYKADEKLFVFNDREVYGVAYGSFEKYYDEYKSTYDQVVNTISIKSVIGKQTMDEIEPKIPSMSDDVDETVSDVVSMKIIDKNIDEITDAELINRLEEMMTTGMETTMDDTMAKFQSGVMDEDSAKEFYQQITEWQIESQKIIEELEKRGYQLDADVITDDGLKPIIRISKPILDEDSISPKIQVNLDELVNEYHFLIDKFDKLGTNSEQLEITQKLIDELNSDLERFENIVILLQYQGYDGMSVVDLVDGQVVGVVSYFEKYTLEPLFERQIPSGAINIFGTMGLIKEFEMDGVPLSYDEQVTILQTSSALIGTIANFSDPSDPDYEISSGMVLAAISAYHPSVDNLKNSESELISSEETPSLKIQEKSGIAPLDIICKEGLQKIFKLSDKSPACVKPATAEKLIERGWTWNLNFEKNQLTLFPENFDDSDPQ